jgi:hypothetical protein
MLRAFVNCNGVKKNPQFILFSIAKGGTKTIAHLSIVEGSSFLNLKRRIYNSKLWNEKERFNQSAQLIFSAAI